MADIFVSYAREDRASVETLAAYLERSGWTVWWDRRILAGKHFDEVIETEIQAARCVVVVWTKHSVKSRWVKVEAGEAHHREILVPVVLDDCSPPLAFRNMQSVTFPDPSEPNSPEFKISGTTYRCSTAAATLVRALTVYTALMVSTTACAAMNRHEADGAVRPQRAVDLILSAFDRHPLVALSDGAGHGQLDTRDFFATLIRDPRLPRTVRNIVVEFGNARHQSVMDRYVSGEAVTRDVLRHVWEDTTQVSGIWSLPMYERMFADVRSVNATLPPSLRFRVLLGDPPIDWSTVTGPADEDMNDWRDAHFAHVVHREVMSRAEKALLFIGGAHISRRVIFPGSLIHLLDARFPGGTYVIVSIDPERAAPRIRTPLQRWSPPAGAPVRDTWLGKVDVREIGFDLSQGGMVQDDVDAILLLSSASPRHEEPPALEAPYGLELARRRALHDATLPFRGARIRFQENLATLSGEALDARQAVLKELLRDTALRLLVKAFADAAEADPVVLSTRRAQLLVDWLAEQGVERDRLVPKGCGAHRPLTFGKTSADRAMNRRAELVRLAPTAACAPPW